MMAEHIERDKVKSAVYEISNSDYLFVDAVIDAIDNTPAADVVEVKHGRWIPIKVPNQWDKGKCSACSCVFTSSVWGTAYCPNCGARMDGE